MLKKDLAGFFAFFLGIFGVHRFYLGQWWRGVLQFAGFWVTVALLAETNGDMPLPFILVAFVLAPIITAIVFWSMPYERWAAKYDPAALATLGYATDAPTKKSWIRRATAPEVRAGGVKPDIRALKAEGVKYYRSGDFDLAVEAFQEAGALAPTDPVSHFNLACCYALLGQYPDALRELELSVTYRLPEPERIEAHPALKELRLSEAYAEFRSNNFRQLNLVGLAATPSASEVANEPAETLEDFATPPRSDGSRFRSEDADLLQQMNRLRELRDAGVLTQKEFSKQREKLLS